MANGHVNFFQNVHSKVEHVKHVFPFMGRINTLVCFSLHKARLCVFLSVYETKNSFSGAVYWQEQQRLFSSSFILTSVSSTIVPAAAQSPCFILQLWPYQSSEWEIFPVSRFLHFTETQGSGLRRLKGRFIWIDTKNSGCGLLCPPFPSSLLLSFPSMTLISCQWRLLLTEALPCVSVG